MSEISFFDYLTDVPKYNYYLYYVCGDRSFHTPINIEDVDFYKKKYNIEVQTIGLLKTEGSDIDELVSVQFARKLAEALLLGNAKYIETQESTALSDSFTNVEFRTPVITRESVKLIIDEYIRDIISEVKKITKVCSTEESTFNFHLTQKQKRKKGEIIGYKKPVITKPKLENYECALDTDEMIEFIFREMLKILPETVGREDCEKYKRCFLELFCRKDSPSYKKNIESSFRLESRYDVVQYVCSESK